jgi:hypothetical protein
MLFFLRSVQIFVSRGIYLLDESCEKEIPEISENIKALAASLSVTLDEKIEVLRRLVVIARMATNGTGVE